MRGGGARTTALALMSVTIGLLSRARQVHTACAFPPDSKGHVTIPAGNKSIATKAFMSCTTLKSVTIPAGVTSIGEYAFGSCTALQSVNIPASVTTIHTYAFMRCTSLRNVTIPAGVTTIGRGAFYHCEALRSLSIPAGVTIIETSICMYCTVLQSVNIPAGVTAIKSNAFAQCKALRSVTIPSSVRTIGKLAFVNSPKLVGVRVNNGCTVPTGYNRPFAVACPPLGVAAAPPWYAGATSLCGCGAGYYNAGARQGTVRCAKLSAATVCDPAKGEWTIRNASAWRGPNAPGSTQTCGTCPPHSTLKSKPKLACADTPAAWRSVKYGVSCADMRSLKACTRAGQYGVGWNPGWGDWRTNADAQGVTAKQACCVCGGGVTQLKQDVNSCACDAGYYDDDLVSGVHCVLVPARFQNSANSSCDIHGMQFGMKQQISTSGMSTAQSVQLATMAQFLGGVDTNKIVSADFNDLCLVIFTQLGKAGRHSTGSICGKPFHLFERFSDARHAILLGTATVNCHGLGDLSASLKMCTAPCMKDAASACCWVPAAVSHFFGCCRQLGCCSGPARTAKPISTPTTCVRTAPCSKCITVLSATPVQCESYGFNCSCSSVCARPKACVVCMKDGHSATECAAVGISCACVTLPGAGSRRRVFGVGGAAAVSVSVATNVDGGTFTVRRCPVPHAPARIHPRALVLVRFLNNTHGLCVQASRFGALMGCLAQHATAAPCMPKKGLKTDDSAATLVEHGHASVF